MNFTRTAIMGIVLILCLCAPVMAAEKVISGPPDLRVSIEGSNEYYPDTMVTIPVKIENIGTIDYSSQNLANVAREDRPNTAKNVVVSLADGDAPVSVKTDSQLVGDIAGGSRTATSFDVRINDGATAGTYVLPVTLEYTYLYYADELSNDALKYQYRTKTETLSVEIVIKPDVQVTVISADVIELNAGTEGYLTVAVQNGGQDTGQQATLVLSSVSGSPVTPTDGSYYIGEFAPGETVTANFKVAASSDASDSSYPLNIAVTYENSDGDKVTSKLVTIGVPVGGEITFEVVSEAYVMYPAEKGTIEVVYKNTGGATAYDATSRISAVDPFTSNDDTAYLGDMAPGETATAYYQVSVSDDATIKAYGLDTEIRYKDSLKNSVISEPMKAKVTIQSRSGIGTMLTDPIVLTVLLFVILGAGYYLYQQRKQKQK
ncbi:S-layer protein [Methanogenium marinum]|uniref:S-layer protein n=1 Tax=Methanogenium marinum TaxID=348610 RepID=A0A9Q4KTS3_9EURY|nr:S-layer protein [Methanogenium marinum]MDE4908108.1 S-layer protein [Methanogenium marinum]